MTRCRRQGGLRPFAQYLGYSTQVLSACIYTALAPTVLSFWHGCEFHPARPITSRQHSPFFWLPLAVERHFEPCPPTPNGSPVMSLSLPPTKTTRIQQQKWGDSSLLCVHAWRRSHIGGTVQTAKQLCVQWFCNSLDTECQKTLQEVATGKLSAAPNQQGKYGLPAGRQRALQASCTALIRLAAPA